MRRETLFSRSGFYGFLLESNVLLHREATRDAIAAVRPVLTDHEVDQPVRFLDLACGGWPVTAADLMAAFPEHCFDYTGVDINPDQVALASDQFPFPDNVTATRLIEGNAWEPDRLGLDQQYTLVFSGMNIHHGTPREVAFLAGQIHRFLQPGGLFISHDVYRPDDAPYVPRPMIIDGVDSALVDPQRLEPANDESPGDESPLESTEQAGWREDYLKRMHATLLQRGADPRGADSTVAHMRSRDYPVSTGELRSIMEAAGFEVSVKAYSGSGEPLGPYVATCVMTAC